MLSCSRKTLQSIDVHSFFMVPDAPHNGIALRMSQDDLMKKVFES